MPVQDGARGDQAMGTQLRGQAPGEGGEDRSIGPSPGAVSDWCDEAPWPPCRSSSSSSSMSFEEVVRPISTTRLSTGLKIRYTSRSDTAAIVKIADRRWSTPCTNSGTPQQ
jgi:hypothetical protein